MNAAATMTATKKYDITVVPRSFYLEDRSDPSGGQFVFAYTITITNTGTVAARLVRRHWFITDAEHRVQEVRGEGVIGQQPVLAPGESFEYTSGATLPTAVGTMHGSYRMAAADGEAFDAPIPSFTLSVPRILH